MYMLLAFHFFSGFISYVVEEGVCLLFLFVSPNSDNQALHILFFLCISPDCLVATRLFMVSLFLLESE